MRNLIPTLLYCLVCFAIGAVLFSTCHDKPEKPNQLKNTISAQLRQRSHIDTVVIVKNSIRTKYLTKFKTIRHDSLIPCETKLAVCDTVILTDSSLIATLKQEISLDSATLHNYAMLTKIDSVTIAKLNKKLNRSKKLNRVLFFISLGAIGVAAIK